MAQRVYSVEEIELIDWDGIIRIHPLTIKKLRKLMEKVDTSNPEVKDKPILDMFLEAVAVAMETFEPKLSDPEVLADHIDQDTLAYVLEKAAGIKLRDENLEAAMRASMTGNQ